MRINVSKANVFFNILTNIIVELIGHFYVLCENNIDKFLILYTMLKLSIAEGKVILLINRIRH